MMNNDIIRVDGRAPGELRAVKMTPGFISHPEGAVLIEVGGTRVICAATVDEHVPAWMVGQGSGWVTAEYALLPRSTHMRTPREGRGANSAGVQGRTQEIQRLIGRSLRAAVDLSKLGERQIVIDCDVIEADGSTRTASVTGGYVALALALQKLFRAGLVSLDALRAPVAAVSVGVVDSVPLLDLCYEEDRRADADFNVVMNGWSEFIEVQGTAEKRPFDRRMMDRLLDLAEEGIEKLFQVQRITLEQNVLT